MFHISKEIPLTLKEKIKRLIYRIIFRTKSRCFRCEYKLSDVMNFVDGNICISVSYCPNCKVWILNDGDSNGKRV